MTKRKRLLKVIHRRNYEKVKDTLATDKELKVLQDLKNRIDGNKILDKRLF